jgi:hypothetical protein
MSRDRKDKPIRKRLTELGEGASLGEAQIFKHVIDAVPAALFLVDENAIVVDLNLAASRMVDSETRALDKHLCGDVLRCANARNANGCGTSERCPDCVVRAAVEQACRGQTVYRKQTEMQLARGHTLEVLHFMVTAVPFRHDGVLFALLTLEDVTELVGLRKLLPMCSRCKKIRYDEQLWEDVESYLNRYSGIGFTYSLCPQCLKALNLDPSDIRPDDPR